MCPVYIYDVYINTHIYIYIYIYIYVLLQRRLLSSAAASSERASPGRFNTFPFLQEQYLKELHERWASYSSKSKSIAFSILLE